jgi:hypothetical protein
MLLCSQYASLRQRMFHFYYHYSSLTTLILINNQISIALGAFGHASTTCVTVHDHNASLKDREFHGPPGSFPALEWYSATPGSMWSYQTFRAPIVGGGLLRLGCTT